MQCPKCKHENRDGAKFCLKCGAKLESVCPKCGAKLPPGAMFCDECGASLIGETRAESPQADIPTLEKIHSESKNWIPDALAQKYLSAEQQITAGENRPITALFADISGFTPLSATKSSEAIFHLVQDCFKQLVSIVAKYEGSISGFRGDGLLALFGAPILHENDAERAILAAIDMREAIKDYQLQVSIGINTAMMTVGEIQTQLHNEYTAYGTDINLAKRLQESAKPGQVLVGAGSHRLTRRTFDFEIISDLTMKGFTQPVTAYSVQQVKVHPEKLRGIEGLRARMIGREHEFTEVKDSVDEWVSGHGQIVSVIGEAGIGKSRLVSELKTYLSSKEDKGFQYIEGRCVSIGQPISYWPFIDILKTYFNLSEGDDIATIASKTTDSITQLMPQSADETLPLLGQLLSIKYGNELDDRLKFATPEQIRHQTLMRLRDIFETLARKQPLLLILEDLHWSDDLSLDLISLLMDELANTPLMLLCIYRPEHDHRVWQLSNQARRKCMDRFTEITLKLLSSIESRELIESLLEIDNLPETIKKMIMDRSEGNPFFIEEVVRSLIEQGMIYQENDRWIAKDEILSINVPDTIQSVILSRVDRLQSESKYILQCASVIGRLFKHKLLDHLTHQERELNHYISEFEDRELVYQERMIPELEYAFKHALTQEATYQSILERKRKEFHLQVAQGIEKLYQERLEDYYEELAEHYSKSDDVDKTLEYLIKAGQKAEKNYANDSAMEYYTHAIEILEKDKTNTDEISRLYEVRAKLQDMINEYEECIEDYKQAIKYAPKKRLAYLYSTLGCVYAWAIADFQLGREYCEKTIAEIDESDISLDMGRTYWRLSHLYYASANSELTELFIHKAIDVFEKIDNKAELALSYASTSLFYRFWNIPEKLNEALSKTRYYLQCQSEGDNISTWGEAYTYAGYASEDEAEKIDFLSKGIYYLEKSNNKSTMPYAVVWLGDLYLKKGEYAKAIYVLKKGWKVCIETHWFHHGDNVPSYMGNSLAEIYAKRMEIDNIIELADQLADSSIEYFRKSPKSSHLTERWHKEIIDKFILYLNQLPNGIPEQIQNLWNKRISQTNDGNIICFYLSLKMQYSFDNGNLQDAKAYAQKITLLCSSERFKPSVLSYYKGIMIHVLLDEMDSANHLAVSVLSEIKTYWLDFLYTKIFLEKLYSKSNRSEYLTQISIEMANKYPEKLQEFGYTQLFLEPFAFDNCMLSLEFFDNFAEGKLDTKWKWIDPKGDCSYIYDQNGLQIDAIALHNMYSGNTNAPRFLREISGDFIIETKITDGSNAVKQGTLLVWKDENNYIRLVLTSEEGAWKDTINIGYNIGSWSYFYESDKAWLRLEHNGDKFNGYISPDGENWFQCGSIDVHVDDPIQVGIQGHCVSIEKTSTRFEYVKIYRIKHD